MGPLKAQRNLFGLISAVTVPVAIYLNTELTRVDPNGPLFVRILGIMLLNLVLSLLATAALTAVYNANPYIRSLLDSQIAIEGTWVHTVEVFGASPDRISVMTIRYDSTRAQYVLGGASWETGTYREFSFYDGVVTSIDGSKIQCYYTARIVGESESQQIDKSMPLIEGFAVLSFTTRNRLVGPPVPVFYRGVLYDHFAHPFRMFGIRMDSKGAREYHSWDASRRISILRQYQSHLTPATTLKSLDEDEAEVSPKSP